MRVILSGMTLGAVGDKYSKFLAIKERWLNDSPALNKDIKEKWHHYEGLIRAEKPGKGPKSDFSNDEQRKYDLHRVQRGDAEPAWSAGAFCLTSIFDGLDRVFKMPEAEKQLERGPLAKGDRLFTAWNATLMGICDLKMANFNSVDNRLNEIAKTLISYFKDVGEILSSTERIEKLFKSKLPGNMKQQSWPKFIEILKGNKELGLESLVPQNIQKHYADLI